MDMLIIIGAILAVLGVIGSIIPAMPGPILSFLSLILLYFSKEGESITLFSLILFGIATLAIIVIDYIAPILGAKVSGASKNGVRGSIIGAIIGILFFPPLGIFIGAFIGAVLGETREGKDFRQAMKAGIGTIVASAATAVLQVIFSLTVLIYFFVKIV